MKGKLSMAKKIYVLDSNILMQSPNAIFGFADNIVAITGTTLQELDKHKTDPGDRGYNTRETVRILDDIRSKGNLKKACESMQPFVVAMFRATKMKPLRLTTYIPASVIFHSPVPESINYMTKKNFLLMKSHFVVLVESEAKILLRRC